MASRNETKTPVHMFSTIYLTKTSQCKLPAVQNSRFGFGSSFPDFGSVQVCIFLTINVVKTDILTGKSYHNIALS